MTSQKLTFVKQYTIFAMLIIALVLATVFVIHYSKIERLTERVLLQQARALFNELILTRRWISSHGGVFVKVRDGVDPNPYLSSLPGLKVNITAEDGSLYTLRNPGLVVRGISELAEESGVFKFHVASNDPVNPINSKPDEFEKKALSAFEQGENESITIEETSNGPFYRYMAPLKFESRCNKCHSHQKLELGDIRGGISISIPMSDVREQLQENRSFTIYSAAVVLATLFTLLALLAAKFMGRLQEAQNQLALVAATDDLTGLYNRKNTFDRLDEEISRSKRFSTPLSCLLLDIDHFKVINDDYGHLAGDRVLQHLADSLKQLSRPYDILCRYGGEEFLIILPKIDLSTAMTVAEKYRMNISESVVTYEQHKINLTVSIGVTEVLPESAESHDRIIGRADEALYQAKEQGRNRICSVRG